jgi:hypothetical protein
MKNPTLLSSALALACVLGNIPAHADIDEFFGKKAVPMDKELKSPKNKQPDPFGSEVFIDGKDNVALDDKSLTAEKYLEKEQRKQIQETLDKSIRADITSGEPVKILIAPDHFCQITFLKENEIVYPKRAFAGQPGLVLVQKKESSPYIYIAASAMLEGQTTNMFVEAEEDGKIQTYVLQLVVTEPKNIRAQIAVNLVDDRTPPVKGGPGSEAERQNSGVGFGNSETQPINFAAKRFAESDVRQYFNTMIEMADKYPQAKAIEKKTGRPVYRDSEIQMHPSGRYTYNDPLEPTEWNIHQIWFFPKYDAILLDVRFENKGNQISAWDYSQVKWQVNEAPRTFTANAASPLAMQTPAGRTNQIWYLLQGNKLDPIAEFAPVFPKIERRGALKIETPPAPKPTPAPVNPTSSKSDGKAVLKMTK